MKYDLPKELYQQCLWIVRGYDSMKRDYNERRRDILEGGGSTLNESGVKVKTIQRKTEQTAELLSALDSMTIFRQMHAVDAALDAAVDAFPPAMKLKVRSAILLSCQDGRTFPYEKLDVPGLSRANFYRLRQRVIYEIAERLQFVIPMQNGDISHPQKRQDFRGHKKEE